MVSLGKCAPPATQSAQGRLAVPAVAWVIAAGKVTELQGIRAGEREPTSQSRIFFVAEWRVAFSLPVVWPRAWIIPSGEVGSSAAGVLRMADNRALRRRAAHSWTVCDSARTTQKPGPSPYTATGPRIYQWCLALATPDAPTAQDVTQNVLLKLVAKTAPILSTTNPRAFAARLKTVTRPRAERLSRRTPPSGDGGRRQGRHTPGEPRSAARLERRLEEEFDAELLEESAGPRAYPRDATAPGKPFG